jgi:hypothetical protein
MINLNTNINNRYKKVHLKNKIINKCILKQYTRKINADDKIHEYKRPYIYDANDKIAFGLHHIKRDNEMKTKLAKAKKRHDLILNEDDLENDIQTIEQEKIIKITEKDILHELNDFSHLIHRFTLPKNKK